MFCHGPVHLWGLNRIVSILRWSGDLRGQRQPREGRVLRACQGPWSWTVQMREGRSRLWPGWGPGEGAASTKYPPAHRAGQGCLAHHCTGIQRCGDTGSCHTRRSDPRSGLHRSTHNVHTGTRRGRSTVCPHPHAGRAACHSASPWSSCRFCHS